MVRQLNRAAARILISALIVVDVCFSQNNNAKSQSGGKKPSSQNNYEYDYGDSVPDYGGKNLDYHEVVDTRIPCYSCTYMSFGDHVQGLANCNEPFKTAGIPEVLCPGPCSKHYFRHGDAPDSDFHIKRDCMPNCKEFYKHNATLSYVQCCNQRLCNGDRSYSHMNRSTHCLLLVTLVVGSLETVANIYRSLSR